MRRRWGMGLVVVVLVVLGMAGDIQREWSDFVRIIACLQGENRLMREDMGLLGYGISWEYIGV